MILEHQMSVFFIPKKNRWTFKSRLVSQASTFFLQILNFLQHQMDFCHQAVLFQKSTGLLSTFIGFTSMRLMPNASISCHFSFIFYVYLLPQYFFLMIMFEFGMLRIGVESSKNDWNFLKSIDNIGFARMNP